MVIKLGIAALSLCFFVKLSSKFEVSCLEKTPWNKDVCGRGLKIQRKKQPGVYYKVEP